MKYIKFIALAALFFTVFVASIGFNILAHEGAHFVVADAYGFKPEMNFALDGVSTAAFYSADSGIAYVAYNSDTSEVVKEDALIASAGPLANLILGCFGLLLYFNPKRSNTGKLLLLLLLTVSLVSFAVNILPFAPSDGYYIWHFLF